MQVIKKNGTTEDFNFDKIVNAITKSSDRIGHKLLEEEKKKIKSCRKNFTICKQRCGYELYEL